ncbi:MAG: acyl-CoA dehydratase activase-related protein [Coriobacteriales bacterium]|jgi:activator of 2-hydroxyglutaryl-CoA dehydratase/predicted nucleotide-binding protein (sugar kinase/HSP70/actin superfamily)|nr:acyl-CoA dehydratase activase-related protein [Coriobacteriales bacterium]
MAYRLGIDAGSKTIKLVLLDEQGATVFSQYMLHRSDIVTTTRDVLHDTVWRFGDAEVTVCVTGSAGMRLAELLGVPHVQEVVSARHALGALVPEADAAIELGGEDAKVIYLTGGVEQRMNGSCAGGTGGFIDTMCALLGVRARQFNAMALGYQTVYPIASRCAVFAQADVRPLLNEGARRSDVAASILQAVVTQTVAGLSCGRPLKGTVVFLGGPFEVYPELVSRFRRTLGLTSAQAVKPPDAHLFVAKGAALLSAQEASAAVVGPASCATSLRALHDALAAAPLEEDGGIGRLGPLFGSEEELAAFRSRHGRHKVPRAPLMDATGGLFVGIDAGSTAVKLAALDEAGRLVYSGYEKSKGEVLEVARGMLEELYRSMPHEYGGDALVSIRHTKVTGYGERLLRVAFNADSGVVETVAHLRAAQAFDPEVDFVLDIGGQDIKCMRVRNGAVDDIMLNESCSSGCGALVDGFSRSLGFTPWGFSDVALLAPRPVDLGTRCTVFMTSRVRHAQKEGIGAPDIAAGLAYSVVRNALYKVIGCTDPARLGERVVVQGGTLKSDAVLRAFELESGLEAVRPDIAEMMGAYGAALLARDEGMGGRSGQGAGRAGGASSLLRPMELASLKRAQATRRCQGCTNNCLLTVNTFTPCGEDECAQGAPLAQRVLVTGNRCEQGGAEPGAAHGLPNLFAYERRLLASLGRQDGEREEGRAPTVGIPNVLDLYESYPFWRAFFSHLGLRVVGAQPSDSDTYRRGAHAVLSEGVCYPAKLAHGHVSRLVAEGADFVFMPTGGSVASAREGVCGAGRCLTVECPVSGGYARLVAEDLAGPDATGPDATARFLTCDLGSAAPLAQQLHRMLDEAGLVAGLSLDGRRVEAALAQAAHEQEAFYERLAERSGEVLARLEEEGARGIVLAGHPYHVDAGTSHGVDSLLGSLGFPVLSASGILAWHRTHGGTGGTPALGPASRDLVAATWTQPAALYEVARIVAAHECLDLVQLYSFGCGVDALSVGQVREVLEGAGKPYTALKMDEMVDLAAIRIRLRSLAVALQARARRKTEGEGGHGGVQAGEKAGEGPQGRRGPQGPRGTGEGPQGLREAQGLRPVQQPVQPIRAIRPPSPSVPLLVMPALAPRHLAAVKGVVEEAGHRLELLPELGTRDIDAGLRLCNNDLCHPMVAVAGQVVEAVRGCRGTAPVTVVVPQMCCGCRAIELEQVIRRQLGKHRPIACAPSGRHLAHRQLIGTSLESAPDNADIEVVGLPSRTGSLTLSARLAARIYDALAAADPASDPAAPALAPKSTSASTFPSSGGGSNARKTHRVFSENGPEGPRTARSAGAVSTAAGTSSALDAGIAPAAPAPLPLPPVGVVGTAALLYTPQLNRSLLQRIEAEGCRPCMPPFVETLTTNAPLERFAGRFVDAGIHDIVCVQSFGCLTGHVNGRGAARRLRRRYPDLNISFIDYDSGASEVNQDNRLKLALTLARERARMS